MKKIFKYILFAGLSLGMMSCDKFFDSMEGDLSKVAAEDLLSSENGLLALLADLYSALPGESLSDNDKYQMFGNPARDIPEYKSTVQGFWGYGSVRSVNKFLEAVDACYNDNLFDEAAMKAYKGEGLFIRACYYFGNVRTHGGIPIVTESLDDKYDGQDNIGLYIPRSTEKDTWDWVLEQFQEAADLLPDKQTQEMRATRYTALAMKARAALWAASESKYWNRAPINNTYDAVKKKLTYMEASYADAYYTQAIAASEEIINSGRFSLYGGTAPTDIATAISNLTELFQNWHAEEGLFGRSYKTGDANTGNNTHTWAPNQFTSGYTGTGTASYAVTLNLADEYDYYSDATARTRAGRKIQTLVDGNEDLYFTQPETEMTAAKVADYKHYASVQEPFLLKDARFQAWVIYPGTTFRGGTVYMEGGMVMPDGSVSVYPAENTGVTKNGVTYYPYGGANEDNSAFYKLKVDVNSNNRSFYCFTPRKSLDQKDDNENTQTPYYDIRYAEVLLTYAEAVIESGQGDAAKAKQYLNDIRHRAGFKDNVDLTLDNVLHEWKVEFPFENKWTNVLHRRRAFYNPNNTATVEEGSLGHKLTLIPMVDLSGAEARWIFLRSLPYSATPAFKNYNGTLQVNAEDYYTQIPNYINNRIEPNNK